MPAELIPQKKQRQESFLFLLIMGMGRHWEWRGTTGQGMTCEAGTSERMLEKDMVSNLVAPFLFE